MRPHTRSRLFSCVKSAVVFLVACSASATAPLAPAVAPDPAAATFGDEAWRMPGTVDRIGFDGDHVIVESEDGATARFAADGTRTIVAETSTRPDTVLATSGKHAIAAADYDAPLEVVDLDTGAPIRKLVYSRGYRDPQIVGDWVIAGRTERAVGIWELATGNRHRVFGLGNTGLFALSPDRELVVTGTFPGKPHWAVDVYRVADGTRTATIGFACNPGAAAISADSKLLAIACEQEVRVVELPGGKLVKTLPGPRSHVRVIAWSPSGALLALGGNDHVLHAWRTSDWQPLTKVTGSRGDVRDVAVAGRFLISHSWGDSSAWLWVTDRVKPAVELGGPGREVLAASTDGEHVLVAVTLVKSDRRTAIERWHGATKISSTVLANASYGLAPLVRDLGQLPDGGVWYAAGGRIHVLDAELKPRWSLPTSDGEHSDGDASATADGSLVILDADRKLSVFAPLERAQVVTAPASGCSAAKPALARDGKQVAIVDTQGIRVLDAASLKTLGSLAVPSEPTDDRAIAWAGADEVAALVDGKLIAWRLAAKSAVELPAPNVLSLAFEADRIYLGRNDGTVTRRTFSAWRATGKPIAMAPAPACEAEEGGGMFGGLFGGGEAPRGRLDDKLPWDEPDPE